ncbi:MAG: peptide deformylase [Bacillota bacterium]|nr:peptide deformylase [Bacillota bacterium]
MAVFKIVELGDPVLREKASPVPEVNKNIRKLLDNLAETMYAAKGVGLAAPQIGVSKRVIVVDVGEGLWELINPEIIVRQGEEVGVEGCLSIPGITGEVKRAARVLVKGWDRNGNPIEIKASGWGARALQHETDHLDGILFIDKVIKFTNGKV